MKRRILLLLVVLTAPVVGFVPPAEASAGRSAPSAGRSTSRLRPPGPAEGLWRSGPAAISCQGALNGYHFYGQGPYSGSGTYTGLPAAGGGCLPHLGRALTVRDPGRSPRRRLWVLQRVRAAWPPARLSMFGCGGMNASILRCARSVVAIPRRSASSARRIRQAVMHQPISGAGDTTDLHESKQAPSLRAPSDRHEPASSKPGADTKGQAPWVLSSEAQQRCRSR